MKKFAKLSCLALLVLTGTTLISGCDNNTSTSSSPTSIKSEDKITLYQIKISKAPNKTKYKVGEKFDKTGMEITAYYDDLSSKVVTDYTYSPNGALTFNDKKITISYTENGVTKTVNQDINVESSTTLSKIEITKAPTKLTYSTGEKFDPMGMEIKATYEDGSTRVVTGYVVTPDGALTVNDKEVTISYTEGEVTKVIKQPITVVEAYVTEISIATLPTKMEYNLGDEFDPTGMVVNAKYSNGNTSPIDNYVVSPSGKLKVNDTALKVTYGEGENKLTAYAKTKKILINAPELLESDYEVAAELKFNDPNNYVLEGGATKATWSSDGNTFDRLRCNKDVNKKIIFEHDYSSLEDKTKAGFMAIMSNARGGTKIEISTDEKATWQVVSEAGKDLNTIPADYKYPSNTIDGKKATDGANRNVFYCYYSLSKFMTSTTGKVYIRFSYEDPTSKGWVGNDTEGTDLIHSFTFYNKLNLARANGDISISSLSVKTMPNKLTYIEGERFDTTGLVLEAKWSDDSTTEITSGFNINLDRGLLSTDKEIIITYEGKEVKINITVSKPASALSKIEVTTNPTKMNYIVGETFDPTGMVITATYEDNTTSIVEDYTLSVTGALKSTDTNIVITYNGKTTTLVIQIKKVVLDETDYTIASVLSFTDANNYKLGTTVAASEGGKSATKGASRKFTDGTEAVRLRANRNPGAYIEVSYQFAENVDLTNAGFMFYGLHTRLGTVVQLSTDGTNFTNIIEPKEGDKVIPADYEEFASDIVGTDGKTDKNIYRMYHKFNNLTKGSKVYIRFIYQTAPKGATDTEGADIFGSVTFYSAIDFSSVK